MGQTTSRLGLYLPGGGSTGTITPDEAADIDKINDNMSKIDAAAGATVCTSATRPASPYNGKLIFETDTNYVRVWDSATSTWDLVGGTTYPAANLTGSVAIANGGTGATTVAGAQDSLRVGLVPIVPTSVTAAGTGASATANAFGQITVTSATSVSVEGVFTSDYKYYRINVEASASTSLDLFFRFRRSNADIATGYAGSTWFTAVNATSGYQNTYTNGAAAYINYIGSGNFGLATVEVAPLTRPQVITRFSSTQGGYSSTGNYYIAGPATTGFTLLTMTGNWSGTFQVFGYNE